MGIICHFIRLNTTICTTIFTAQLLKNDFIMVIVSELFDMLDRIGDQQSRESSRKERIERAKSHVKNEAFDVENPSL
jgi:hypothetical protein